MKLLVAELGFELEACNEFGDTALHIAGGRGQAEAVEALVQLGANLHARNGVR